MHPLALDASYISHGAITSDIGSNINFEQDGDELTILISSLGMFLFI